MFPNYKNISVLYISFFRAKSTTYILFLNTEDILMLIWYSCHYSKWLSLENLKRKTTCSCIHRFLATDPLRSTVCTRNTLQPVSNQGLETTVDSKIVVSYVTSFGRLLNLSKL